MDLRGVTQRINVQDVTTPTEAEQAYRITAICSTDEEVQLRSLMLHMLNGMPALVLQSLHCEDVPSSGKADVLATPGNKALLEQLASRVSMEPAYLSCTGRC